MPETKEMPTDSAIKEAWEVITAQREAEYEKRAIEARKLVGKCFKYRNSYSDKEKWWLYAIATDVDELGWLSGVSFQHTANNTLEIRRRDMLNVQSGGWIEITAAKFWQEAAVMQAKCAELLAPR